MKSNLHYLVLFSKQPISTYLFPIEFPNWKGTVMNTVIDEKILRIAVGTTNPCKIKSVDIAIRRILENNRFTITAGWNNNHAGGSPATESRISNDMIQLDIQGCNVESDVPDQPYADMETKIGAMNRARNAYFYYHGNASVPSSSWQPDLAIGIEGGLEMDNNTNNSCTTEPSTTTIHHQQYNISCTDQTATTQNMSKPLYCMAWIAVYGCRTELTNAVFATMTEYTATSYHNDSNEHDAAIKPITTDTHEIYGFSKTAMFLLPPALSSLILDQGMELGHADDLLFRRTNSKQASGTVGLLTNAIIDRTMYYEHAILLAMIPWMHPHLYPNGHTHHIDPIPP